MSSQEQIHITGFSRLIVADTIGNLGEVEYSGVWISKDRNWLICPTSSRVGYQLIPISQDAGILMFDKIKEGRLIGTLEDIIAGHLKLTKPSIKTIHY